VAKLTVAITAAIHFHLLAGGIHKDRAGNLLDHLRDPIRPDLPDHDLLRLHRGGADTDLHHVHPDLLIQGNTRWFKIIRFLEHGRGGGFKTKSAHQIYLVGGFKENTVYIVTPNFDEFEIRA
jgi:hypothetical protein